MDKSDDKKTKIADAAITVFAEKGFSASTIPDLAKQAGLGEATIYNHFRNKEEILLTLPLKSLRDFEVSIKENLKGLKDPEEKLRRFIWQYLWWIQSHKELSKVFVLEIMPNPQYFHSETYRLIRELYTISTNNLEEGKKSALFKNKVNTRAFRPSMARTVYYHLLTRVLFKRSLDVLDDFDDIATVFVAAVKRDEKPADLDISEIENKKERILLAAEDLFSKKMFAETRISEIAAKASVADGTIYEYFENKDDLLFSIYEKRMKKFSETFSESLCPQSPETKLKYILLHFLTWVKNNRQWARVYLKDLIPNPKFYVSVKHSYMTEHDEKIKNIFTEGIEKGAFRGDIKVYIFRALVIGTLAQTCYPWAILHRKYNLVDQLDDMYELILNAIKTRNPK